MAGNPYNVDYKASSIDSLTRHANLLTGILLQLGRAQFSSADYIHHPQLKQYVWSASAAQSRILIEHVWNWKVPDGTHRPAVLVRRNPITLESMALADGGAVHVDSGAEGDLPISGDSTYQMSALGSHTIFCLATLAAEAELVAAEVATRLMMFAQVIRRDFGFSKFALAGIGELAKVEEASEYFGVPINVAYRYMEAWKLESAAPFLKGFMTELPINEE